MNLRQQTTLQRAASVAALAMIVLIAPASGQDWTRNFRVGMSAGLNLRAEFEMAGEFPVSGAQPGIYSDGFVLPNSPANDQGYTWNWGYDNASQVSGSTLNFQRPDSYSTAGGSREAEDDPHLGFDMAYGGTITRWNKGIVGWEFGFQYLPVNIEDRRSFPATITSTLVQYQVPDGVVLPEAPYEGSATGPGVSIVGTPSFSSSASSMGTIGGGRELDMSLYNFRLGPTLHWELHRYVAVAVSGGFAMGVASGDYNFSETIELSDGSALTSSGSFGSTDLVYGGYAGGVLLIHVQNNADIYLGAHFISLSDFSLSQGGRGVTLDLSQGIYLSGGISWPF